MMKFITSLAVALLLVVPTVAHANVIGWGYEDWGPASTAPAGWGTYNLTFTSNGVGGDGQSTATSTIGGANVWGKTYYGTGLSSAQVIGTYKFLYVNTYDVQGDMKLAISGASDADFYDVTPHVVSGNTGDPNVIFNPGPYVFDMSGWAPGGGHANVQMQLIAEGGASKGFTINRVFMADYNPMAPIPEPTSLLLLGTGLVGLVGFSRRKK